MNKTSLILAAIVSGMPAMAAEVRLSDCPPEVQKTIRENSRSGKIDEIESFAIQGKTLYLAEVELPNDRDLKIHVNADGTLVKTREDSSLAEAPEAVKKAVEAKLGGGVADDVDKEVTGNAVEFHVEIERQGTPDLVLVIDESGKVLKEIEESDD